MTIVGHRKVVDILERELPPVTLLAGPASVGKWTLACHLAEHHRVAQVDRFIHADRLRVEDARAAKAFVSTAPLGAYKLVILWLDDSTTHALNALLKILEEPPPTARFLLTASHPTLPTIYSRAQIFRLGLLNDTDVMQILLAQGVSPASARRLAPLGRGQVQPALKAESLLPARTAALAVARALATGDPELFDKAFTTFDDAAGRLLRTWLHEAFTGQHCWYTPAETAGFSRDQLHRMLISTSRYNLACAGLGMRAALESFLPD